MKISIVELMLDHDGYKCGYCRQRDTAYSQGMWAHRLNAIDYQSLIDRGWRRSGHYCYKPTMNKTCCPQYTIRLRNEDFQFTKSKKKIINKMKQFLISGGEKEMKKWHDKYANNSQTSEINKHEPVTQQSLSTANEAEANSNEDLQMPKSIDLEFPKSSKTTLLLQPAQENNKDLQIPNAIDQTFPSSKTKSLPRPGVGPDPNKPPAKKAKQLRLEKLKKKDSDSMVNVKSKTSNVKKSTEDFLPHLIDLSNAKHKLEVRLVRADKHCSEFLATKEESHKIYTKYQTVIHGDNPDECNEKQWMRFLVDSPINYEAGEPGYGSYHQHYLLDGRIIAVGVIDILPHCVSSVYLYYDPDYGFLSLGVYSAISEIAFSRSLEKRNADIKFYYMGYYIQSCPKMRYKNSYRPSELLCPETYLWVPVEKCISALEENKYCRLIDLADNSKSIQRIENDIQFDINQLGILYNGTLYKYNRFITAKYYNCFLAGQRSADNSRIQKELELIQKEKEVLTTYTSLVGVICAYRMYLYRPPISDSDESD